MARAALPRPNSFSFVQGDTKIHDLRMEGCQVLLPTASGLLTFYDEVHNITFALSVVGGVPVDTRIGLDVPPYCPGRDNLTRLSWDGVQACVLNWY